MTEWVPISQIPGVTMLGDPVPAPAPPSQPMPNRNKKKILIGIGAGLALLAIVAGIWFFFNRDKGTGIKPTIKSMLAIVGQSVTKEEENFVGRRKGKYQFGPDAP